MIGKIILVLLALTLTVVAICTWGSLGSGICIFLLVELIAAMLFKTFVSHRKENDFDME
jgi:hypothetical protein